MSMTAAERRVRPRWAVAVVALVAATLVVGAASAFAAGKPGSGHTGSGGGGSGVGMATAGLLSLDPLSATSSFRAPNFKLTDQHGRAVSLSSFRGKAVILSFIDNHGQGLSPLYAGDVRAAVADLGVVARRVAFVGVNVNPLSPSVASDVAFDARNRLSRVSEWHFLTGPLATLKPVWHAYGVSPVIGPDNSVEHPSLVEFVDPTGRVRDLGSYGPSSADSLRWGYALAVMAERLLGVHTSLTAKAVVSPKAPAGAEPAPSFSTPALNGPGTLSLASLGGRPVVMNFFASWCSACKAEAPGFNAVARRLSSKVAFIGIAVENTPSASRSFLKRYHLSYPVGLDSNGTVAASYQVSDLPTTIFISSGGRILSRHLGYLGASALARQVDRLAAS